MLALGGASSHGFVVVAKHRILLDFPFTGEVALSSSPFDEALQQIPSHMNEAVPHPRSH